MTGINTHVMSDAESCLDDDRALRFGIGHDSRLNWVAKGIPL